MYGIPKAIIIEQPLCADTYSKENKIKFENENSFALMKNNWPKNNSFDVVAAAVAVVIILFALYHFAWNT